MNLIQTVMHLSDSVLLPIALWAVMFAMGTGLSPSDFIKAVSGRRAFLLGGGSMLFLVPAAGSLLAVLFGPTPALVVGRRRPAAFFRTCSPISPGATWPSRSPSA